MEFPKDYFEDEIRDGFYVPGMMKRAWAAQLEVLDTFRKFCAEYDIRWFATFGTLLGAARHNGFVPWDDDMDVCMLRSDYEKFLRNVNMMPDAITFMDGRFGMTEHINFDQGFGRIVNTECPRYDDEYLSKYHGFPYTAGVDIFVLDKISPDPKVEEDRYNSAVFVYSILLNLKDDSEEAAKQRELMLSQLEKWGNFSIDRGKDLFRQLILIYEGLCCLFEDEESDYVASMSDWVGLHDRVMLASDYSEVVQLPFENTTVNAPVGYKNILTKMYGDYMVPVKGSYHNYPFYRSQEQTMEEAGIRIPYNYHFDPQILEPVQKNGRKKTVSDNLSVFMRMNRLLMEFVRNPDESAASQVFELGQRSAEQFQNFLLAYFPGPARNIVQLLTAYHEEIFALYKLLTDPEGDTEENQDKAVDIYKEIGSLAGRIEHETQEEIIRPKEVVFILFKACGWKNMEGLYRYYKAQKDVRTYVIPLVWYHKNDKFLPDTENPVWEAENLPQDIEWMSPDVMDLSVHTPDVVVTQNAYDNYAIGFVTDPRFFSDNVEVNAGRVIYTPWFNNDEAESEKCSVTDLAYTYIDLPGVMRADCVLLPSEQKRQLYIDNLTEFAGEKTRPRWESRIYAAAGEEDYSRILAETT